MGDKMIGMDIISTETHTADVPGASAQISDSTGSDGVFATTAKLGGFGLRSADKGIITNAANTLVVGDKIRIENQVRNVVFVSPMCVSTAADAANVDCSALTAVHYVEVDEPFTEDAFSSYNNIFDAKTTVERLESDSTSAAGNGDDLQSCVVTDMRALSSTTELCVEFDGPACGTATVSGSDPHANRIVTMHAVGDRIRIVTAGGPRASGASDPTVATSEHVTLTSGGQATITHATLAPLVLAAGDDFTLSSCATTGAKLHQRYIVKSRTSATVVVANAAGGVALGDETLTEVCTLTVHTTGAYYQWYGFGTVAPVWETRTIDSVTYVSGQTKSFSTYSAYSTTHTAAAIYNVGTGTTEVSTCSGRGLCDESTGECACFSGFTDVDRSTQNALSI